MPVLDLKNATIYMKDGHTSEGKVDNVAGYTAGAVTMIVDTFTVDPPIGATFTIEAGTQRYLIGAGSSKTLLNFTPGLLGAVADEDEIHVGARQIEVKLGDGNLTYSETKNREYISNRGRIDEVRDGDEAPVDVSLTAQWQFITGHSSDPGGGHPTIEDVLKNTGLAADWESSDTEDPCRPYSVDLEIFYEPICDTVQGESIMLRYFRYEKLDHDARAGTIATTGKCNVLEAEATRFDQTPTL
jgi:hypothetical protein